MASISIADFIEPDDRGAGYLLRRVLRRAIDSIRTVTELHQRSLPEGISEAQLLSALAETTIDSLGDAFPELRKNSDRILRVIDEEVRMYTTALIRNVHLMKLAESLQITLSGDAKLNSDQICDKISQLNHRVSSTLGTFDSPKPEVNQSMVDALRREHAQLVALSTSDQSLSTRFGLTSEGMDSALTQLDRDLVDLESRMDTLLQEVIAQFEVEAKRKIVAIEGSNASILSISNDCIDAQAMDFFLLKAAADLFGTDRPLAVLLKEIPEISEQSPTSVLLQLTVPSEFQSQLEAQVWFDRVLDKMEPTLKASIQTFPIKNKRVKRIVRFRVKLTEDNANISLDLVEQDLRRRLNEIAIQCYR